jgi:hypothetical protein
MSGVGVSHARCASGDEHGSGADPLITLPGTPIGHTRSSRFDERRVAGMNRNRQRRRACQNDNKGCPGAVVGTEVVGARAVPARRSASKRVVAMVNAERAHTTRGGRRWAPAAGRNGVGPVVRRRVVRGTDPPVSWSQSVPVFGHDEWGHRDHRRDRRGGDEAGGFAEPRSGRWGPRNPATAAGMPTMARLTPIPAETSSSAPRRKGRPPDLSGSCPTRPRGRCLRGI